MIAVYEYVDTGRRASRTLVLFVLAMLLSARRPGRPLRGASSCWISSVVILWLKRGRRSLCHCYPTMGLVSPGFLRRPDLHEQIRRVARSPLGDNLPRVAEGFGTYWLGGIVAFDQTGRIPTALRMDLASSPNAWPIASAPPTLKTTATWNTPKFLPARSPTFTPPSCLTTWITAAGRSHRPYVPDGLLSTYVYRCAFFMATAGRSSPWARLSMPRR